MPLKVPSCLALAALCLLLAVSHFRASQAIPDGVSAMGLLGALTLPRSAGTVTHSSASLNYRPCTIYALRPPARSIKAEFCRY